MQEDSNEKGKCPYGFDKPKHTKAVWTQILFLDVEDANYDSLLLYSEKALMFYPTSGRWTIREQRYKIIFVTI